MKRTMLITMMLVLGSATLSFAQGITGQWKAVMMGMDQEMEIVYTFKTDGEKLTGAIASPMGDMAVMNGKVTGADYYFEVDMDGQAIPHKGTVSGDTMTMNIEGFQDGLSLTRVAATTPMTATAKSGIDGKWKAVMEEMGMELVFTFKVDGNTLMGSVSSEMGDMPISNGKVNGDTFTFDVDTGGDVISHNCTYAGDSITMTVAMFPEPMKLARVTE